MDMTGQQHIAATREEVWSALNDAEVLKICIPGCQELTKSSDTQMSAVAVMQVGPVKARFQGAVTLSDLDPPNGYKITGEGQGGVAGFARGVAIVRLEAADGGTVLHYTVDANIGGKLSQLGARLIDVTAKQMSGQFFKRFAEEIHLRQNAPQNVAHAEHGAPDVVTAPVTTGPSPVSGHMLSAAPAAASSVAAPRTAATASAPFSLLTLAAVVIGAVLVAIWAVYGGLLPSLAPAAEGRAHVSPDLASALQMIMAAAIGYLFGARARD